MMILRKDETLRSAQGDIVAAYVFNQGRPRRGQFYGSNCLSNGFVVPVGKLATSRCAILDARHL